MISNAAIEDREDLPEEGEERERRALKGLQGADVLTLEALQEMAMDFATWLHRKGAQQMAAGGEKAAEEVRALSQSFNRAARAVRQTMILKEEAAGLRPTPGTRIVVGSRVGAGQIGANHNGRAVSGSGGSGRGASGRDWRSDRDRRDEADRDEEERREQEAKEARYAYIAKLMEALAVDIEAAGPEWVERAEKESVAVRLTTIADSIPHPTLDAALARIQLDRLQQVFRRKPGQAPPGQGPP